MSSASVEDSRGVRSRRLLIGAVAVLLVVVAVLVVMLTRSSDSGIGQVGAATAAETVSLETVVPGEGAMRQSVNVPSVGVDYPDSCVGAAQAAGGWSAQVFAVADAAVGVEPAAFSALVLDEIMIDDPVVDRYSPVTSTAATADAVAEAAAAAQPMPEDVPEFDRGGFKLESCTAGQQAVVTVVGTVLTTEWSYDPVSGTVTTQTPYRDIRCYEYHLVSQEGVWRLETLIDDREALGSLTTFGEAWVNADYVMTDDVRAALKADLGVGAHLYISAS